MKQNYYSLIVFTGLLLFWELIIRIINIPAYLLPTPLIIFNEIYKNFPSLLFHSSITLAETLAGFALGSVCALLISLVFVNSKLIRSHFLPYFISLKTIPIIAVAPLVILWFGHGIGSKVIIVALACFFPILVNSTKGFLTINKDHLDLFKSLNASKLDDFIHLRIPSALPYIFAGLKVSATLAVLGAIVGEFIGANKGLGFLMLISSNYLETATLFSAIIMTSLIGMGLFSAISFFERKIVFWVKEE